MPVTSVFYTCKLWDFFKQLEHAWLKGDNYKIMMVYKQGTFQVVRSLKLSSEYQAMFFKQEMNDQDETWAPHSRLLMRKSENAEDTYF